MINDFTDTLIEKTGIAGTSCAPLGLKKNTTYYWRVRALGSTGISQFSAPRSFSTSSSAVGPPPPPMLAAPADSTQNISLNPILSWNAVAVATTYHLQVSTAAGFSPNVVDDTTLTATSKQVGQLSLATKYYWRVRAKNDGGYGPFSQTRQFSTIRTTSVEKLSNVIPTECSLSQNYPNPFNPTTIIEFALPKGGHVSLKVFDLLGKEIATLVSQELGPGYFAVRWQADVPSGTYIYRLQAEEFIESKKMILLH